MEVKVDGIFFSNDDIHKGKKLLTYIGVTYLSLKLIRVLKYR